MSRPPAVTNAVAVAGGAGHSLALRADGTVAVWGDAGLHQRRVPVGLSNVVAAAAGAFHNLALRADGTVAAWGADDPNDINGLTMGQSVVPSTLTNAVAVAAGWIHSLALRADGTVIAWGANNVRQTSVPPGLGNVVAIASGQNFCLALKADGTVVAWGHYFDRPVFVPDGLSNVVAISASSLAHHSLALRADGTLIAWGPYGSFGELNVPPGLSNVAGFAGGGVHNLVLKTDGTVIAWGGGTVINPSTGGDYGQSIVPASLTNAAAIGAGYIHSLALAGEVAPFLTGPFVDRTVIHGTTTWFHSEVNGSAPLRYQWRFNGTGLPGATNAVLALENVDFDDAGAYSVEVSNGFGTATSPGMALHVAPLFITDQPLSLVLLRGQPATFQVTASGTGPFTYQWQFNGADMSGETNRSLVLTNVQSGQTGTYAVTVANALGSVRSSDATLSLTQVAAWGSDAYGQTDVPAGLAGTVMIAGGLGFSLALKSDGTVAAWGRNEFGETAVPAGLTNAVAIAAGNSHALALTAEGTVIAWGHNGFGQTNVPPSLADVVVIAAGDMHNLVLKRDGTVVSWGSNSAGQTNVPPRLGNVVGIAAGREYSLALGADGTVTVWGTLVPGLPLPGLPTSPAMTNVVAVAGGRAHYLALRADGTVVACGSDQYGQATPPLGLTNAAAIAAGQYHSLALTSDGKAVAWGPVLRPGQSPPGWPYGQWVAPPDLAGAVAIAAGYYHNLAIVEGGAPFLLEPLVDRTILHGTTAYLRASATGARPLYYRWRLNGADLPGATNAVLELAGVEFASAGRYSVVVSNALGMTISPEMMLGVAPLFITAQPQSQSVSRGTTVQLSVGVTGTEPFRYQWRCNGTDLAEATNQLLVLPQIRLDQAGQYSVEVRNPLGMVASAAARLSCGPVIAWGSNSEGQTNLPPGLTNVVAIAAGNAHNLALRADGTVVGWGWNENGQTDVPADLTNAIAVQCGTRFSLALRADGTVSMWGHGGNGETNVPRGLTNLVEIEAGHYHSLARRADGTVAAWGYNEYGQGRVPYGLTNVVAIAAGGYHNLALRSDGSVFAWGDNGFGQRMVPPGLSNVVAIAAGGYHSLVLRADGKVVAWGYNSHGQTNVPPGLTNVVAIAGGDFHSLALKRDGTLVAWGDVSANQLGIPVVATNVVAIAAGSLHSLALVDSTPLLTLHSLDVNGSYFRQTGLRWERVSVLNPSPLGFTAVRVVVQNLTAGATVYNASGTNTQGQPYVQYNQPLAPGASVDLTIEYFVPSRSIPNTTLTAEAVDPVTPLEPSGTPQDIARSLRLEDASYLIDFSTLANRTYYVQYSSDLASWKTAFPPVAGSGSTLQWVDNGPPKTDSHPSTQTNRFYRVLLVP